MLNPDQFTREARYRALVACLERAHKYQRITNAEFQRAAILAAHIIKPPIGRLNLPVSLDKIQAKSDE